MWGGAKQIWGWYGENAKVNFRRIFLWLKIRKRRKPEAHSQWKSQRPFIQRPCNRIDEGKGIWSWYENWFESLYSMPDGANFTDGIACCSAHTLWKFVLASIEN